MRNSGCALLALARLMCVSVVCRSGMQAGGHSDEDDAGGDVRGQAKLLSRRLRGKSPSSSLLAAGA